MRLVLTLSRPRLRWRAPFPARASQPSYPTPKTVAPAEHLAVVAPAALLLVLRSTQRYIQRVSVILRLGLDANTHRADCAPEAATLIGPACQPCFLLGLNRRSCDAGVHNDRRRVAVDRSEPCGHGMGRRPLAVAVRPGSLAAAAAASCGCRRCRFACRLGWKTSTESGIPMPCVIRVDSRARFKV